LYIAKEKPVADKRLIPQTGGAENGPTVAIKNVRFAKGKNVPGLVVTKGGFTLKEIIISE
jgi:hypothetical protein